MAQGPNYKEEKREELFILNKDKPNRYPEEEGGILRPKDWTPTPYKGKDGKDYHTLRDLQEADRRFDESRIIPEFDLGEPPNNLSELKFPIIPPQYINFEPNKPLEQVLAEREKRGGLIKLPIESSVTEYTEGLKRYFRVIEDTNDRKGEAVDPLLEPENP